DYYVLNASQAVKEGMVAQYVAAFDDARKATITNILNAKEMFVSERMLALETINQNGGIADPILRNATIFNMVMEMSSVNSKLDILRVAFEENELCNLIAQAMADTVEN